MVEQKEKEVVAKYTTATGRRKESVARVYLRKGKERIRVNKREFRDYFPRESHRLIINQPIETAGFQNKLEISATINGGGTSGQAQALKHGISRAIIKLDETKRPVLKKAGFLTRDSRAKERKKYGRKRARKRFQYSKR